MAKHAGGLQDEATFQGRRKAVGSENWIGTTLTRSPDIKGVCPN
jgi:hypothetical protein